LGEVVKQALAHYGYEVLICANCARGENPRLVAGAKMTPPFDTVSYIPAFQRPAPPKGSVDFGVTNARNVWAAYHGIDAYASEGPRQNLRLIANIQSPSYLIVAAKSELGITDLGQIKEKRWPVRILTGAAGGDLETILEFYGLSQKAIEAAGGHIGNGSLPEERASFDLVIAGGSLGNAPEYNVWYEVSQKHNLTYLQLPEPLLDKIAKTSHMERGFIPNGLLRGIERPIPTVVRSGTAIYGRVDTPDEFAYLAAKAMDEHQDLLQWSHLNFSYNSRTVWKALDLPLHPGAERYYRERRYIN
jgi:TRAP transporter TAXI family solute receptor